MACFDNRFGAAPSRARRSRPAARAARHRGNWAAGRAASANDRFRTPSVRSDERRQRPARRSSRGGRRRIRLARVRSRRPPWLPVARVSCRPSRRTRTAPHPVVLSEDEQAERVRHAKALAAKYRAQLLAGGTCSGAAWPGGASLGRAGAEFVKLQCPGIAAVSSQTVAVGMQETPYINSISARAVRSPVIVRMLRDGDMSQKSYHFLPMADRLAQLLHCLMESVACPMASCAEADSRTGYRQRFDDVGVVTGVPAVQQTI